GGEERADGLSRGWRTAGGILGHFPAVAAVLRQPRSDAVGARQSGPLARHARPRRAGNRLHGDHGIDPGRVAALDPLARRARREGRAPDVALGSRPDTEAHVSYTRGPL